MTLGTVRLSDGARFAGMAGGDVVVEPGARAIVGGMVAGDVIVGAGAEVEVTGMVAGTIVDRGGRVRVRGMVGGH